MTGALERQIAAIICTEKNAITVRYVIIIARSIIMHNFITVGSGSSDCGLFAISFAATLAVGKHPSAFLFYQRKMREHLHSFSSCQN